MSRKAWRTVRSIALCCVFTLLSFTPAEAALADLFGGLDWISFAPTNFDPSRSLYPAEGSLREDLRVLCGFGFRGIVTYDAWQSLGQIPRLAREACFRGAVMGIWCVIEKGACARDRVKAEFDNAVAASPYVDGYVVGNEYRWGSGFYNCRFRLECGSPQQVVVAR